MTQKEFWELIAQSRHAMRGKRDGAMDRQAARLESLLAKLEPSEIVQFRDIFERKADRAFDLNLWAVAYIIAGGCSDDWFAYFRFWLISLGRENFQRAVRRPSGVGKLLEETRAEDIFFEQIAYVPARAYRHRTGQEIPSFSSSKPAKARGKPWKTDEDLQERFPALYEKYFGKW